MNADPDNPSGGGGGRSKRRRGLSFRPIVVEPPAVIVNHKAASTPPQWTHSYRAAMNGNGSRPGRMRPRIRSRVRPGRARATCPRATMAIPASLRCG